MIEVSSLDDDYANELLMEDLVYVDSVTELLEGSNMRVMSARKL